MSSLKALAVIVILAGLENAGLAMREKCMARRGRNRRAMGGAAHAESLENRLLLSGTWTKLANAAPGSVGTMMLLPNGSVMTTLDGDSPGSDWGLLTPNASGSYINGTWARLANANDTRLFDASQVLQDGRVFVAGGEYGTGAATGETYNPLTNTWTRLPAQNFGSFIDANSILLPNGNVLIAPVSPNPRGYTTIFNPTTNTWSQGPKLYRGGSADEQSWLKLADDSVIMTDGNGTSERYIPSLNQWINDGTVPVSLFDGIYEEGAATLLSDGRAFFIGATGHTAIYTPSGSTSPGSWVAGPDLPGGHGTDDAPLAMLPDGTILCVVGPAVSNFSGPTAFYIYDPVANAFSTVTGAPSVGNAPFLSRLLDLPDGTALYTSGGSTLYEYNPGTAPLAIARPAITAVMPNADGSVTLSGTGLNGIDAGAAYGDDAQMDSNYPIVRLTSGSNVYYARTHGWTSTSVATGSLIESTDFTLPLGIPAGTYSLVTVANGIASAPASLTISMTPNNLAPTVTFGAEASAAPVTGTTTNLSVLGDDDAGESNLSYTWTTTAVPSGATLPSFSVNGTNAAKNTVATFHRSGTYTFNVVITDAGGLSVTSAVTVSVNQTETSITLTPAVSTISVNGTTQFTVRALDQFGGTMTVQPAFTWSVLSGLGSISTSGKYTAPNMGTLATISVADANYTASSQVGVLDAPWSSADIGPVGQTGMAYDSSGAFTVKASGSDVWGTSDQFRFVYRSFSGDGSITARVTGVQNTDPWAKAGVMIRNSTGAGDSFAFMAITPGQGATLQDRVTSGGSAAQISNTTGRAAPYWVRLIRSGTTITGYISSNGAFWVSQGSVTIPTLGTTVDFGLAVTAHNNSALCTATFSNVQVVSPATSITLTPQSPNPSDATQPLNFVASVTGGVPDGETISLQDASNGNKVVATGTLSNGSASLTIAAGTLPAGTHDLVAAYGGDPIFAASQSAAYAQVIQAAPPTLVGAPVINGDDPNGLFTAAGQPANGKQRSMVEDIVYTFNEAVTIPDANAAFTVAVAGPAGGTVPSTLFAQAVAGSNGTQWAVSLTGQPVGTLASIDNGEYSIQINPAGVFSAADGTPAMAAGTGRTDTFFRLFGDIDGNESVSTLDYGRFKQALNGVYNPAFDYDGNGSISTLDYGRFKQDMPISYFGDGFIISI
jgi:regulation of enolase protein 1 (concanavalin A-like superfamily)